MKQHFVAHLKAETAVRTSFLVHLKERKTANNGAAYLDLSLRDSTGVIGAKLWDCDRYSFEFEVHESYLKLVDRESNNVITVVEILSPANKVTNSVAKRDFDAKRNDVLSGGTHFVEIDLLRQGAPRTSQPHVPPLEYMAQVWRFPKGELKPTRVVWPMSIRAPLKPIPIPVRPQDPDAVLDLQRMLDIAYERAGYELRVNYAQDPIPPLSGELAEWARRICSDQSSS